MEYLLITMQSFLTGLSQATDLTGEQHNEGFNLRDKIHNSFKFYLRVTPLSGSRVHLNLANKLIKMIRFSFSTHQPSI